MIVLNSTPPAQIALAALVETEDTAAGATPPAVESVEETAPVGAVPVADPVVWTPYPATAGTAAPAGASTGPIFIRGSDPAGTR